LQLIAGQGGPTWLLPSFTPFDAAASTAGALLPPATPKNARKRRYNAPVWVYNSSGVPGKISSVYPNPLVADNIFAIFFLTQPVGFRYHKRNLGRGARVVLGHASATGGVHMHLRIIAWLTAAVLCLVVGVGVAQEKVKGRLPQGFAKLGLSDEQKQKIYKIQAEYDAKVEALEAQIKKLREEERTQIFAVLTPQQKELYLKLRGIPEAKPSDTKPEK
jgi:hypothetical protein